MRKPWIAFSIALLYALVAACQGHPTSPSTPIPTFTNIPTPTITLSPTPVATPTPIPTFIPTLVPIATQELASEPAPYPESVVCAYGWDCATAMEIFDCETGGTWNPSAVGNNDERGWAQIHPAHFGRAECDPARLFEPAYNIACAWALYQDSGWTPWISCW